MHFTVIARDSRAPGTLEKRLSSRAEHMEGLKMMKADGRVVDGGAMLDADGNMVGSVMLLNFPDRTALEDYLAREPYQRDGVWGEVEIIETRFVDWQKLMAAD
ncbi:YciI family protein [Brucella intermedia]|uniref:YciI family protein n=1 Tax=Brucella intermedia TaxID=94625 RepID=UPI00224AC817|nr:YciI family protein [Brucella intermedia]